MLGWLLLAFMAGFGTCAFFCAMLLGGAVAAFKSDKLIPDDEEPDFLPGPAAAT